ncbi:MAG: pyridoxamine 5'-phosphate oxidase family protein, partial [Proteobacteria bacterium]|nr:pyridoxamine 5'-phosphate oxidase family protein [Pseudomonadota bacterium]MDA1302040.1 pyridoxamine 5'-phosphate oxidase family protein [Pseudomonadota bacterium]
MVIDEGLLARITAAPVARLATRGEDGRLHQVPIVFVYDGECLFSPVDGKPKRSGELPRVRNVAYDPVGSLLIDIYHEAERMRIGKTMGLFLVRVKYCNARVFAT